MLVLSRRVNQEVIIGENIRVMIIDVRGDNVRLGIEAPRDVPVHRREIMDKIRREHRGIDYDPNHPDGEYA